MATATPDAFASVHDDLALEAGQVLHEAASRLERPMGPSPAVSHDARREAIDLAVLALELLHRAELAALGVHEAGTP